MVTLVLSGATIGACAGAGDAPRATTVGVLSADELCRLVPAAAVTAALGEGWPRVTDPAGGCRYQSAFKSTSTVTIAGTGLTADAWRSQVTKAGGKVVDRDGVLVADYGGDGFGPLDELWWVDPSGAALVLRVDNGVTLEQAVALVNYARNGAPATTATPGTTESPGTTGVSAPLSVTQPP
jgi:hypothetical protein